MSVTVAVCNQCNQDDVAGRYVDGKWWCWACTNRACRDYAALEQAEQRIKELEEENERLKQQPDFLSEALNSGDGVYRP